MYIPIDELKRATQLTREGKLSEATSTIRRALGIDKPTAGWSVTTDPVASGARPQDTEVIDVEARLVPDPREPSPAVAPPAAQPSQPARFEAHRFASGGHTYPYRLFIPPRTGDASLPVIVMLHGCTQDSADFATGTAMNDVAARHGCIVVYPEQLVRSNSMRCWNWFDASHQQRGHGEPEMIAALAARVVQQHHGDAGRVYVAGLSAGGAMAVLAAQLRPDVFAAVGVHSGLPAAAAHDLRTAHAAMSRAARQRGAGGVTGAAVPTIVFHGTADTTVHPANADHVIDDAATRMAAAGIALRREQEQGNAAGRSFTRTVYTGPDGVARLERWEIQGGAHAWSGGNPAGSCTDPAGPSASEAMVEFFLPQKR